MQPSAEQPSPSNNLLAVSGNRWPLVIAAASLGAFAITKRSKTAAALTVAGVWALRRSTQNSEPRRYEAKASFAINCTAEQAYQQWRNFEDIGRFLRHVESVREIDDTHSEWTAEGAVGKKLHWTAEIVDDVPNQRIEWRSMPGSEVDTRGVIEFRPRTGNRGIVVTARIEYAPPAGSAGKALAALIGRHPEFTVREDLRRFKAMIEAGEIPTTVGQSHGPRGLHGRMYRAALRETVNLSPPQASLPERQIA